MKYQDIAIIGMSGKFPEADNLDQFWSNLLRAKDSIRELPQSRLDELKQPFGELNNRFVRNGYLDRIADFDAGYFNISPEEARFMDPQHRITMELLEEAIQNSGYGVEELAQTNVSTFIAFNPNRYAYLLKEHPLTVANSLESALAGRIAYSYNFKGPAVTVDTACSSFMIALHQACVSLIIEESDYSIVGGCHLFPVPFAWDGMQDYPIFAKSEKLSAFAKGADGTLGGEGGGVVILKKLSHALRDKDVIHAVIKSTVVNSDAALSNGFSSPSRVAQTELIQAALKTANLTPDCITFFEAHGTGTELGDPIEVAGIDAAFKSRKAKLPIGTVKTNVGHLVGMAGFAGLAKAVLAINNRKVPESLHFDEPNPHIDFNNSVAEVVDGLLDLTQDKSVMRACISSFGIIGTNGHAIVEQAPQVDSSLKREDSYCVIPLSARTKEGLYRQVVQLKDYLSQHPNLAIAEVAATLANARRHLKCRDAFVAASVKELIAKLEGYTNESKISKSTGKLLFSFAPGSLQPLTVAPDSALYCYISESGGGEQNNLFKTYLSAKFLMSLGINPNGVLGWAQGVHLAGAVKGSISIEDAIQKADQNVSADSDLQASDFVKKHSSAVQSGYEKIIYFGDAVIAEDLLKIKGESSECRLYCVGDDLNKSVMDIISAEYCDGQDINWLRLYPKEHFKRLQLPVYSFEKKYYFVESDKLNAYADSLLPQNRQNPIQEKEKYTPVESVAGYIKSLFDRFLPEGMDTSSSFVDNGGDSLAILDIIDRVKKAYNLALSVDDFYEESSIQSLVASIVKKINISLDSTNENKSVRDSIVMLLENYLPDDIKLNSSFNANGGDSLAMIDIVDRIKKEYNLAIATDIFFDSDTLEELIQNIIDQVEVSSLSIAGSPAQSYSSALIASSAGQDSVARDETMNVLLTGASGFYGVHLLRELMLNTPSTVYCLVRGSDHNNSEKRLRDVVSYYFGEDLPLLFGSRIKVIPGDVTKKNLGIDTSTYNSLMLNVDKVIHSAADVRQVAHSKDLELANVVGTENIIEFCLSGRKKELHHCSTYVVSGRIDEHKLFAEKDLVRNQTFMGNHYAKTKYDAEVLVNAARQQGLSASIYRIGNLTGRYRDGKFQYNRQDNLLYTSLKAICELDCYPEKLGMDSIEICPVDLSAVAFVKLFASRKTLGKNYHLMYPAEKSYSEIFSSLRSSDMTLAVIKDDENFKKIIEDKIKESNGDPMLRRFKFFYDSISSSITDQGVKTVQPTYDFAATLAELKELDFVWPELDSDYFKKMMLILNEWASAESIF